MSLVFNIVKIDFKKKLLSNLWEPTTLRTSIYIYTQIDYQEYIFKIKKNQASSHI
jgi:hypothetical protein